VVNQLQGRRINNERVSKFHFQIWEFVQWISEMELTNLRFDDRLDGASNFLSWKVTVTLLLEENDIKILSRTLLLRPKICRSW
jgi:hypothetical protein